MLADEGRLLLVRQAPPPGSGLGRASPLPLAAPVAPTGQPPTQPPHGVQDVPMEFLQDVEDAQLVAGVRPEFGQQSPGRGSSRR